MTDKTPQSPYINTTLISPVMLYPNQMDNKIYLHLKSKKIQIDADKLKFDREQGGLIVPDPHRTY